LKKLEAPFVLPGVEPREDTAMVRRVLAVLMVLATFFAVAGSALAQSPAESDPQFDDATPPRLSYSEGSVSFWRPGGDDWTPAQVNTPLAVGDELYTGRDGNLEVQVGGRAFIRAWGDTQLGLTNQDPNFVQLRLSGGHLALDLRSLDSGDVVEVDTPAAAFTIDQPGYYRVDVSDERTAFVTRRSGRATITTASGPAGVVQPGEAIVFVGTNAQRGAAPELDVWDRWNDTRTTALLASVSTQYVPPQVYGVNELDRYGSWRTDATYGSVWVPASVATDWAPYSSGRWIWDPRFGWTWLDTAPWGWAPYHYGRWVSLGGAWAWAPGPIVVRPVYAPALVAFFGVPGVSISIGSAAPVGWVALGWGEPVVPWWGRPGFVGRPHWAGWGGPRVRNVTVYRNVTVVNAVVAVRSDHFGRRPVQEGRIARPDISRWQPVHGRLDVKPDTASFTPRRGHAVRPPDSEITRRVVATRPAAKPVEPPRARDDRQERRDGRDPRPEAAREQQPGGKVDARPDGPRPDVRREPGREPDGRREPGHEPDGRRGPAPRHDNGKPDLQPARPSGETPTGKTPTAKTMPTVPAMPPASGTPPHPEIRGPEPARPQPTRPEPPRTEQPRNQPPRVEPGRNDTPRTETPRGDQRRVVTPPVEPPRIENRRTETPRVEPPRVETRPPVTPRVETREPFTPRVARSRRGPRRRGLNRPGSKYRVESNRHAPNRHGAPNRRRQRHRAASNRRGPRRRVVPSHHGLRRHGSRLHAARRLMVPTTVGGPSPRGW
jgi:hypothetical protein